MELKNNISLCFLSKEIVKFHVAVSRAMNSRTGIEGNDDDKAKAISSISIVGIIIGALGLLSGLAFLVSSSYQSAVAQQNTIEGSNATGTSTTDADDGIETQVSACLPTQTGSDFDGASSTGTNATTTTTAGTAVENESTTSEARMHIVEACIALQAGDTQAALMHLNLALNALEDSEMHDNVTTTANASGGNNLTGGEDDCDGITVGGTSAADDYDCTPDAE